MSLSRNLWQKYPKNISQKEVSFAVQQTSSLLCTGKGNDLQLDQVVWSIL